MCGHKVKPLTTTNSWKALEIYVRLLCSYMLQLVLLNIIMTYLILLLVSRDCMSVSQTP